MDLSDNPNAQAIEEAVRYKTVGVAQSGEVGSGTLVSWKGRRFVLTAAHVAGNVNLSGLRFILPFTSAPAKAERHELDALIDFKQANLDEPVELPVTGVLRDETLHLAAIELKTDAELRAPAEFFDLDLGAPSPQPGQSVTMTGFPVDLKKTHDTGVQVLFTLADWNDVAAPPETLEGFNPEIHFVVPFGSREQYPDADPHGFSGAGVWYRKGSTPEIWHANLELGGVIVTWFKKTNLLKVVKREAVEAFFLKEAKSRE